MSPERASLLCLGPLSTIRLFSFSALKLRQFQLSDTVSNNPLCVTNRKLHCSGSFSWLAPAIAQGVRGPQQRRNEEEIQQSKAAWVVLQNLEHDVQQSGEQLGEGVERRRGAPWV
jgi:hypothetical protein